MIESRQDFEKRERSHRANEVIAGVVGQRAKRPNLKRLYRNLVYEGRASSREMEPFKQMIAESRARVQAQKAPTNGNDASTDSGQVPS
jgi:hypothetical protein